MSRVGLLFAALAFLAGQSGQPPVDRTWPPPGVVDGQSKGVVPPMAVHQVNPSYAPDAMRERIEGTVVLKCVIQTDGSVGDIRVATSLDPRLDQNAIAALKQWTFKPARSLESGTPIPVAIRVELGFHLKKPGDAPGPVSAWPTEFAHVPDTSTWTEKLIDLPPLQLKISYPPTWHVREFPGDANRVATAANSFFTRTVETSSGVWLWFDLAVATKDLPNPPPAVGVFPEARLWMFTASIDGQYIPVSCMMLVPARPTPEHRQAQLDQTTAEFAGIMRHLSIGHR
jgi:TonB family protein